MKCGGNNLLIFLRNKWRNLVQFKRVLVLSRGLGAEAQPLPFIVYATGPTFCGTWRCGCVRCVYPMVTSKMLLPTELDTAMSPNPFLATITLVMRSGMLVPAARNVRPITCQCKYALYECRQEEQQLQGEPKTWHFTFVHIFANY